MSSLYTLTTNSDYWPKFVLATEDLLTLTTEEKTHVFTYIWSGNEITGRVYVAEFDDETGLQTDADEFDGLFRLPEEARRWYGAYREQAFEKYNMRGAAACWEKFQTEIANWTIEGV